MSGDVLPLDLPGSRSSTSSPLGDIARQFAGQLDELTPADRVLVVMVEQLAATIDSAARTGKASAAAMAARELREAIAYLQARRDDEAPDAEAAFVDFREYLVGSIAASSCDRCASCSHEATS